jgi:biopolymer transport protein ExbD
MSVIDEIIKNAKKAPSNALQLTAMVDMFTIMIVFLLKSYDTSTLEVKNVDNLVLPASISAEAPEEALLMLVSQKGIFVGDKKVADIVDGKIDMAFISKDDEDYIKPLFDELNAEAKKIEEISKRNPAVKFEGQIFMQADKMLSYAILKKVLYTATMAGYGDLRLATLDGKK